MRLTATSTASAFTVIHPDVCYAGVHTQAESVSKLCVRKMCVFCVHS